MLALLARLRDRDQSVLVGEPHDIARGGWAAATATPWPARRASSPSSRTSGMNAERVVQRIDPLGLGVCHVDGPIAVRRSCSQ